MWFFYACLMRNNLESAEILALKRIGMAGIIFIVILVGTLLYVAMTYNKLVAFFNRSQNAFAQIDVQLKRRYDLIPNLIEVAKTYMAHEKETLLSVTNARNNAVKALQNASLNVADSTNITKLNIAENSLLDALKGLNITMEAYPDLKANETLQQLNNELSSTENKIAFSRQAFNDSVMNFNVFKQSFPCNIIVGFFPKYRNDMELLSFSEDRAELEMSPKVQF